MSKDTVISAPSTIFFDTKDKLMGTPGTLHDPQSGELQYDRARPDTIAGEINVQLRYMESRINHAERNNQDTFNIRWDTRLLKKAKNTVNSVRAFGDAAPVNQNARLRAADDLTKIMLGSVDYSNDLSPEVRANNEQIDKTRLYVAAALGHRASRNEIQKRIQQQ